jgi:hypothetical protein
MTDQDKYVKVERIPAIRSGASFTNFHRTPDGLIGERVKEEEATHFLVHYFHIEEINHEPAAQG